MLLADGGGGERREGARGGGGVEAKGARGWDGQRLSLRVVREGEVGEPGARRPGTAGDRVADSGG